MDLQTPMIHQAVMSVDSFLSICSAERFYLRFREQKRTNYHQENAFVFTPMRLFRNAQAKHQKQSKDYATEGIVQYSGH